MGNGSVTRRLRRPVALLGLWCGLLAIAAHAVAAAEGPNLAQFGYPTVAASAAVAPDQAITITAGDQSVAIRPGTFDGPVTFELLTGTPAAWASIAGGRTVRAAFAFRVRDTATGALLATFKQPVVYRYRGADARPTDVILNTTAAVPPAIAPNSVPITFEDGIGHPFTGTGVGWLLVSSGAESGPAAGAAPAPTGIRAALPALLLLVTLGGALAAAVLLVRKRPA